MSKKLMLLAAWAATLVTVAVFPAIANAGEWKQDCPGATETCAFSMAGGHAEIRVEEEPLITCISSTGSGSVSKGSTTGIFALTFKGCSMTLVFNIDCHTSGSASGEIKIAASVSHNIYLKDDKTDPGRLYTVASTTIICFSEYAVTGAGMIGDITQGCGAESSTSNLIFEANPANSSAQRYEQNTLTGSLFDLHAVTPGSPTTHTFVLITPMTQTFVGGGKGKITCV
jgi:hypothetical protein